MDKVAQRRECIYNYFHSNHACQKYFFDASRREQYVAYYNSMYLLQHSTESLSAHRRRDFSKDSHLAYLEFLGVLQAAIIQQDSIKEIYEVIVGQRLDVKAKNLAAWSQVRELRDICAGHPAKKDKPRGAPVRRTFMPLHFGSYDEIWHEQGEQGVGTTHPRVRFGALLDAYAEEVERLLSEILARMKERWPQ